MNPLGVRRANMNLHSRRVMYEKHSRFCMRSWVVGLALVIVGVSSGQALLTAEGVRKIVAASVEQQKEPLVQIESADEQSAVRETYAE